MASLKDIAAIGRFLSNRLDSSAIGDQAFAGVIGDGPSHYSKSPRLWNAAFQHLRMRAVYLPFDVDDAHLGDFLRALKESQGFLGANVTVPYKVRVMEFLDSIDADAERIQAVNTIVKTADGRLIGANTDGEGFTDSILKRQPDSAASFIATLEGMNVLLLGAGGSARAVAFHVADKMSGGKLLICNRTPEHASSLAGEIKKAGGDALAVREEELPQWAPQVGLIVNSTTKGQAGIRRLAHGTATFLEPYSALAPAQPPIFAAAEFEHADGERKWKEAAGRDIHSNHNASMQLAGSMPGRVAFYDLIYHPEETVFLRHARVTGHPTMNGKAMIINQAVIALCKRICNTDLQARGMDTPTTSDEILEVMYSAW